MRFFFSLLPQGYSQLVDLRNSLSWDRMKHRQNNVQTLDLLHNLVLSVLKNS